MVFVCECGRCGGELVRAMLFAYDRIRATDACLLVPGHGNELRPSAARLDPSDALTLGSPPRCWCSCGKVGNRLTFGRRRSIPEG